MMLKLTFRQKLRVWLWQQRRTLTFILCTLVACGLTFWANSLLLPSNVISPLLTLAQLGAGGLVVILVIILSD
jgi:polyferredoxin